MGFSFRNRGRGVRRSPGKMNKTEEAYSEHLQLQYAGGAILWWKYEGITFKLAPDTRFTPDFAVMRTDGVIELHEVKGFFEEDAKVKIKTAAEMFPFEFLLVRAIAKKHGGGWTIEPVGNATALIAPAAPATARAVGGAV